jgi:hypothetical protein
MKLDDLDQELDRLREVSDHIAANLVELEIDSSRQLLEASALSGTSATRWAAACAALTDLWAWRALLDDLLSRAGRLRSKWRSGELRSLLTGPSVELSRVPVPLTERDLLGDAEISTRCTPAELLAHMSSAFDEAKTIVGEFGAAWSALAPRLRAAGTALAQAQALASKLGESERRDLLEAADRIERLGVALGADPLGVDPAELDTLIGSLEEAGRDLEAALALRAAFRTRLADARGRLAGLRLLIEETRAAHEEASAKVTAPASPPPPALPEDLGAQLDRIDAIAQSGAWREARSGLDGWSARVGALLADAQQILEANRAPVQARNQLRGLLDAYRVKAGRMGAIEDPELERIHAEAHEALYTAPTDLTRVAQLVRHYQEILSARAPTREAVR